MTAFTESVVEEAALAWLEALGYAVLHGPEIADSEPGAERSDANYRDVVLDGRLHQALVRLNPDLPHKALEDACRKLMRSDAPSLVERNRAVHRMLVDGITVEYRRKDGSIAGAQARVVDFDAPNNNDWLAVNQFTVADGPHTRRPDVVLFVNGLPLAVIELKNPADENATVWSAFHQLQTYQAQIPALFATNAALIVSDGVQARIGSLGAGKEWFKPWRTIAGREDASAKLPELQVVLEGVFERFPALKLVLIEAGFAWLPSLCWRLDKLFLRMRAELPHLKRLPSEYIREHVWLTSQPMEEPADRAQALDAIEWIGWDRLLFATDYPHWDYDDPAMALPGGVSEARRRGFFMDNARAVYGP